MNDIISQLDSEHLDMLFYFALKKTGHRLEAEELVQEIAYGVMVSLNKGHMPENFDAWLWGIARKCYVHWVRRRKKEPACFDLIGASCEYEPLWQETRSPDDEVIRKEEFELLRRELTLLSKEHRELLVPYYIDRVKLSYIAQSLGLPEGTAKRRLFELRKHLREGMQMARTNGQRSYAPENINFTKSGQEGSDGSPWTLIRRAIPKNILLEAYNNPCTVEELSLALGIAAPYMEDEVGLLAEGTLLKRLDDGRYETDFIIIGKNAQTANFEQMMEVSETFCPLALELLDEASSDMRDIGFMGCELPSEELCWLLLPMFVDCIIRKVNSNKEVPKGYTQRPHGGKWDIMGYETCELPIDTFVGLDGNGNEETFFATYRIKMNGLTYRAGDMGYNDIMLVADILKNRRQQSSLSLLEKTAADDLVRRGFIRYEGESVETTFPVFNESQKKEYEKLRGVLGRIATGRIYDLISGLFDYCADNIRRDVPARLEHQVKFVAGDQLCDMRMLLLRYALECGRIRIPDDIGRSTVAMYMVI
jgi:RNA polymerase sigma factor (sigma-70 family)